MHTIIYQLSDFAVVDAIEGTIGIGLDPANTDTGCFATNDDPTDKDFATDFTEFTDNNDDELIQFTQADLDAITDVPTREAVEKIAKLTGLI